MAREEESFLIIDVARGEKGILKTIGEREIMASVKLLPSADSTDNDWLMEEVKLLYMRYYSRVKEYSSEGGMM